MKEGRGDAKPNTLAELVGRMEHLKTEHTPLLAQITNDKGMSGEVRNALLAHLHEEENELLAQIALQSPGAAAKLRADRVRQAAPASPPPEPPARSSRLTVGSLRKEPSSPAKRSLHAAHERVPKGTTIGSLRRR